MAKVATIVERLNELFNADPRNDSAIASSLGVSKQTVSAWKSGTRSPKRSAVKKIADYYGVSEEWLFGWDMDRPPLRIGNDSRGWHPSVVQIIEDSIEASEGSQSKLSIKRQEELKLFKILDSLPDEGRKFLLKQAEIAVELFGGKK